MSHFCEIRGTGNTGTDPTMRTLSSGTAVVNLRLCVHRRWRDASDWRQSQTWLNLVFTNHLADEAISIAKGTEIYFEGYASDRDVDERRSVFEVQVKRWHRLGESKSSVEDDFYF